MTGTPDIVLVIGGVVAIGLVGVLLVMREMAQRELLRRARRIAGIDDQAPLEPARSAWGLLTAGLARFGDALRGSLFFAEKDIETIRRAVRAAGFASDRAVGLVMGAKSVLLVVGPLAGYAIAASTGKPMLTTLLFIIAGMALGSFVPNWILSYVGSTYRASLRRSLPDALDLLVVCTEAGLGLESGLERVTQEMRGSAPGLANEFTTLLQDMRISSDRRAALMRMGDRTGVDSFQRLGGTLAQTLRYGTPVGQALRVLAAEMRTERMVRLEERAARLPALLVLPMILFILPCLFVVLAGPAAIRIMDVMGK
jgi:tight adherence protein C